MPRLAELESRRARSGRWSWLPLAPKLGGGLVPTFSWVSFWWRTATKINPNKQSRELRNCSTFRFCHQTFYLAMFRLCSLAGGEFMPDMSPHWREWIIPHLGKTSSLRIVQSADLTLFWSFKTSSQLVRLRVCKLRWSFKTGWEWDVFKPLPSLTSTLFCSWDCENEQRRADFTMENIEVHRYIISGTISAGMLIAKELLIGNSMQSSCKNIPSFCFWILVTWWFSKSKICCSCSKLTSKNLD